MKRITGARDLTTNEYVEGLREDKRRKEEAEEKKKKEERKCIRDKRECKKREKQERGRGKGRGRGRGRGKRKEKATSSKQDAEVSVPCLTHYEGMSSSDAEIGILPSSSGGRRRQLPARFRNADDSDGNDGVLCNICTFNEPEGLSSGTVFWVDCDKCGSWVYTQCLCFWQ